MGGAHRTMSQPASSLLASAQAVEAAQALVTAMALCQRHSSPEAAAAAAAEQLWFRLLHSFVQARSPKCWTQACAWCTSSSFMLALTALAEGLWLKYACSWLEVLLMPTSLACPCIFARLLCLP